MKRLYLQSTDHWLWDTAAENAFGKSSRDCFVSHTKTWQEQNALFTAVRVGQSKRTMKLSKFLWCHANLFDIWWALVCICFPPFLSPSYFTNKNADGYTMYIHVYTHIYKYLFVFFPTVFPQITPSWESLQPTAGVNFTTIVLCSASKASKCHRADCTQWTYPPEVGIIKPLKNNQSND